MSVLGDSGEADTAEATAVRDGGSELADSIELLFEQSLDLLCVAGVDGYFKVVNPAFSRVLGYDRKILLETPFIKLVHPDDVERTIAEVSRLEGEGSTVDFENRYRCRDGQYVWLQWNARSLGDSKIYCVARDVTEQRRLLSLTVETQRTAQIGGWELDLRTDELFWTEQTYLLHEVDPESFDLNLETAVDFYAPQSLEVISEAIAEAQTDGKPWDLELEIVTAKGNRRAVRAVGRIEFDGDEPAKAFGSFQDVTERKRLEEQLLHSQKLEGMGRLAGGVAHDFNNLLTIIVGNVALVEHLAEGDEEARECLAAIQEAADQACHVTGQLLAFARKQIRSPKRVCLASRVQDLLKMLQRMLGVDVQLVANLESSRGEVLIDPGHFELALINLTVNARDAIGRNGTIEIHVRDIDGADACCAATLDGPFVEVVLRDNGSGIAPEVLSHIFDPFFTTKGRGKGTGLGLATSQGVVEQNGGQIHVESEVGKGTAFHLYFPVATTGEAENTTRGDAKTKDSTGQTVLLLEDDDAVRRITRKQLQQVGYQVLEAEDGPTAIDLARRYDGTIDAIVSDIVLPVMNGRDAVAEIKKQLGPVPVLFVSGFVGESINASDLERDGAMYLQKPYSAEALHSCLQTMSDAVRACDA